MKTRRIRLRHAYLHTDGSPRLTGLTEGGGRYEIILDGFDHCSAACAMRTLSMYIAEAIKVERATHISRREVARASWARINEAIEGPQKPA